MTRSELINLIIEQCPDLESSEAGEAVQLFFDEIISGLTSGNRIELRGFGSFSIKSRAPRIARNPKTNEKINIQEKKLIKFKMSKEWFKKINEKI